MTPRPLIAVTDSPFPSLDPAKAALARLDPELRMAKSTSADDILAVARDADAILVTYAKLPGELLRQLTRCKAIGRFGLGVDNIDITAAAELRHHGHLRAGLLHAGGFRPRRWRCCSRWRARCRSPTRWCRPAAGRCRPCAAAPPAGQVLGLIGFGNIPRALAPKAQGVRAERDRARSLCLATDVLAAAGVEGVSFDDLLARSDFISVHAPLMPATRGLVNAAAFAQDEEGRADHQYRARAADRRGRR